MEPRRPSSLKFSAVLLLLVSPVAHSLSDQASGARATGMAEAYVAVADDAAALHYNPAGLAQIQAIEVTTHHAELLKGLSDGSDVTANEVGYAQPLKIGKSGALGISYRDFQGAAFFKDRVLALGSAWNLSSQWAAGATLKRFQRRYETDLYTTNAVDNTGMASGQTDPLFAQHGRTLAGYGVDLGLLYQFGDQNRYRWGLMMANVNEPSRSLNGSSDKAPMSVRTGFSYRPHWGVVSTEIRRTKSLSSGADTDAAIGLERTWPLGGLGLMDLRGGYSHGSRDHQSVTAGLSVRVSQVELDYSFGLPMGSLAETEGNHRAAFTVKMKAPSEPTSQTLTRPHPASPLVLAPQVKQPSAVLDAPTLPYADDQFKSDLGNYLMKKKEGSLAHERLALLQDLYQRYGDARIDLSWLAQELSSL